MSVILLLILTLSTQVYGNTTLSRKHQEASEKTQHLVDVLRRKLMNNNYDYQSSASQEEGSENSRERDTSREDRSGEYLKRSDERAKSREESERDVPKIRERKLEPMTNNTEGFDDYNNSPETTYQPENRTLSPTSEEAERAVTFKRVKKIEKQTLHSDMSGSAETNRPLRAYDLSASSERERETAKKHIPSVDELMPPKMIETLATYPDEGIRKNDLYNYVDDARLASPGGLIINRRMHNQTDGDVYTNSTGNNSVTASYKHYKVLRMDDTRRMGSGRRKFIQEQGIDGVAILKTDDQPFPEFRLGGNRRQYMAAVLTDDDKDSADIGSKSSSALEN